ncbi:AAA family ATPase [Candidatus Pantoea multigeneris]|uniref:AAA family ATPase n=1 Tax=Candidatus Pantoea multigeneris TaxID=2608357 RepID=A0ABX0RKR2_9GAMM|nr:AAA family ATPase [Pantoea multigeneris]NIF23935.1 AAA family ATPase [Pantoea multigeneris]
MAGHYISRENLENEKTILRVIAAGKNRVEPLISEGLSAADCAPLTNGQRQAANLILTSRDQVIAISGHAGVGKTTQYRTVATAIAALNGEMEIVGLAPTHRAVSELQHAGIPSQTIASFLNEQSTYQQAGEARDFSKKVFVIDESSMSGNAQKAQLLTIITEGGGRVVPSGDRDQLKSLESGMPFGLVLDRSAAEVAAMTEIVRQTPALKPAIEAIIAGDVRGSLEIANSLSPEIVPRAEGAWRPEKSVVNLGGEGGDIHGMIAQDYANRTAEARDGTMILTELNKDRELVNEAVHNQLSGQGVVSDSVTVPVLVRVNNSNADLGRERFWVAQKGNTAQLGERYFTIGDTDAESGVVNLTGLDGASDRWISPAELRKESAAVFVPKEREMGIGEKVRLTATDRERNISANDSAVVTGITAQGQLELDAEGKSITLDPNAAMADRHIDYGYAVTTYSAQGASVRYMIGLVGVESGRKNMAAQDSTYVQISRAKEHVQLYGDNVEKWIKAVENRSGRRQTVHDMVMHAEDIRAGREAGLWDKSQPVSETRIAERMDQHVIADARFVSGKSPELLWPVVNSHGRHRGNLHVPVTPATGHLDFSSAHYEGANDGNRVVMQRGERHGKVLEAADVDTALQLIAENPGSPVVVVTDHSERGEAGAAAASERAETASGEELTRNEDEALDKALEASREKEPDQPEAADEKADPQADGEEAEWEGYGLDDEDALQQTADYFAAYDMDHGRQAEPAQRPLDENVNQVRSPTTQPDHDFVRQPQKTLE